MMLNDIEIDENEELAYETPNFIVIRRKTEFDGRTDHIGNFLDTKVPSRLQGCINLAMGDGVDADEMKSGDECVHEQMHNGQFYAFRLIRK